MIKKAAILLAEKVFNDEEETIPAAESTVKTPIKEKAAAEKKNPKKEKVNSRNMRRKV